MYIILLLLLYFNFPYFLWFPYDVFFFPLSITYFFIYIYCTISQWSNSLMKVVNPRHIIMHVLWFKISMFCMASNYTLLTWCTNFIYSGGHFIILLWIINFQVIALVITNIFISLCNRIFSFYFYDEFYLRPKSK